MAVPHGPLPVAVPIPDEWFDVTAGGAVGDGTTDDTLAIQGVLDEAGTNATIVFPNTGFSYRHTSPLRFHSGQVWIGQHGGPQALAAQTKLAYDGAPGLPAITPDTPATNTINVAFEGLAFDGGSQCSSVIDLTRTSYSRIRQCFITTDAVGGVGILLDAVVGSQCYFNIVEQTKIIAPVGIRFTRGANANQVVGGAAIACGTVMEFLSASAGNVVIGMDMEESTVRHVYLDSTANTFIALHMEGAPIGYEITANGSGSQIIGTTYATSVVTPISEAAGNRAQLRQEMQTQTKPKWRLGLWQMVGDWVGSSTPWQFDALPFSGTASSLFDFFRNTTTTGIRQIRVFKGDGSATNTLKIDANTGDLSTIGRLLMGPTFTIQVLTGAGSPEGVVAADPGSLYLNRSGGVGTAIYVKQTGFGTTTGWAGK